MTTEELVARSEVEAVLRRYCTGVDRKDWALMRSAYHDDAIDDHGLYRGDVDGLMEWLQGRHENIEQSMHFLGNSTIEVEGDHATGETYCILNQRAGDTRITVGCRYLDRFERRDGTWRISSHVVAYEWWREESAAHERMLPPECTTSKRSRADALYQLAGSVA